MACLRLFTVPPLPPRPLFSLPRLKACISRLTSLPAEGEYLRLEDFFEAVFLLADFFAEDFLLAAFFVEAFLVEDFFVLAFFVERFFALDFFAAFFVAIDGTSLRMSDALLHRSEMQANRFALSRVMTNCDEQHDDGCKHHAESEKYIPSPLRSTLQFALLPRGVGALYIVTQSGDGDAREVIRR